MNHTTTASNSDTLYIFVAHTNLYSGNFERQLTAYATGQVGECEVGDEYALEFNEEVDPDLAAQFSEMIKQVADEDNGCRRPTEIWPTPGRGNNGYGVHFDIKDDKKHHPAYESVAMFFSERPTDEMIALMKVRCHEFAENGMNYSGFGEREELKILGFQLLHRKTVTAVIESTEDLDILK
jgi:hypothetical protein